MADPRFFKRAGPFRLAELADIGKAELASGADGDRIVTDVASLESADAGAISFFEHIKHADLLSSSKAGFCIVRPAHQAKAPPHMALLISKKPQRAYALIGAAFHPERPAAPGIDERAHVEGSASIDPTASVASGAVIGAEVEIGAGTRIGANTVIGDGVRIGAECRICLLYTSPSPRDLSTSRMPSSA